MTKNEGLKTSELLKIVGCYLKSVGSKDENPTDWLFSGCDTVHKITRVVDYMLELNPDFKRKFMTRVMVHYYSLGKTEYDKTRLL